MEALATYANRFLRLARHYEDFTRHYDAVKVTRCPWYPAFATKICFAPDQAMLAGSQCRLPKLVRDMAPDIVQDLERQEGSIKLMPVTTMILKRYYC